MIRRRKILLGAGAAAAVAGSVAVGAHCRRRSRPDRPNILILLSDQQRYPYMSAYGHPSVRTPGMDEVALRGILATHAFAASPQCSPARASLLTGLFPHKVGTLGNMKSAGGRPLPMDIPSLGPIFADAGYQTAYFGKWHLGNRSTGVFGVMDYCGHGANEEVVAKSVAYLKNTRGPFLLFASFLEPHNIYKFKYASVRRSLKRDKSRIRLPENLHDDLRTKPKPQRMYLEEDQGRIARKMAEEDWINYLNLYEYLIESVDYSVDRILTAVDDMGLWDSTVIVLTSDHGDFTGAHGLPFKGPACYDELVRIPLAMAGPDIVEREIVDDLISHVDLLPTLGQLCDVPMPEGLDGHSFAARLRSQPYDGQSHVIAQYYSKQKWINPIRMLRTRDWKYNRYARWGEELYDLRNDPGELHNLADRPGPAPVKQELVEALETWMEQNGDPFLKLKPTDRSGKPIRT